ncbi:MAG: hypothetical protein RLY93_13205 [Sumerlaeia bacterium]
MAPAARPFISERGAARAVALAATLWLLAYWGWAHATGRAWIFEDDAIRINFVQVMGNGQWPHEWGYGWLPLPTLWGGLWASFLGEPVAGAVSAGCLAAMVAALWLTWALARRLAPRQPLAAALVVAAYAASPIVARLAASALSEPLFLALALGAGWLLGEAAAGRRWALAGGLALLVGTQAVRYEAWAASLLTGGAMIALFQARARGGAMLAAMAGMAALAAFPALWSLGSWIQRGDPFAYINDFRAVHYGYHADLTVARRLARLGPGFQATAAGWGVLVLTGAAWAFAERRERDEFSPIPLAVLGLATLAFLLLSAIRGEFAHVALDRFVAIPMLLLLPLAARPAGWVLDHLQGWRRFAFAALGILAAAGGFLAFDKGYALTRLELRENLMDLLAPADVVWFVLPEGQEDVLPNSLSAIGPPSVAMTTRRLPAEASARQLLALMNEGPGWIVLDPRFEAAPELIRQARTGWRVLGPVDELLLFLRRPDDSSSGP